MSDNLQRFSAFTEAERVTLIAAAARARALDHKTNRGSDYERSIRAWVRDFVEPEYTVSEGEVIDSFNTNSERDSRQRDAIVHRNTRYARRYTFGEGMRLVPIESVALLLEVKLTVDHGKFAAADDAAREASGLRLALDRVTRPNVWGEELAPEGLEQGPQDGLRVSEASGKRVWYGLIAADGPPVEKLAEWLRDGTTLDFVCCLSSGCASRLPFARGRTSPFLTYCDVAPADRSLARLADLIRLSLNNFEEHEKDNRPDYHRYQPYMAVRYHDDTGYKLPLGATHLPDELAELRRMGKDSEV